jgi:hypothetical protein
MRTRPKRRGSGSAVPKGELLQIRLTAKEKLAFRQSAELAGLAISAWVRERLRQSAVRELQGASRQIPFLDGSNGD